MTGTVAASPRTRLMMADSTSASSGLTTRSRSESVLDGVIWSRGTSSPVLGRRYCTRLWCVISSSSSIRTPVVRRTLDRGPGPEREVFLHRQIAAPAGGGVVDPDPAGGVLGDRTGEGLPGEGEALPGIGSAGRQQECLGGLAPLGDSAYQDREDGQPLAGACVHA